MREKYDLYTKTRTWDTTPSHGTAAIKLTSLNEIKIKKQNLAITDRSPYASFVYAAYYEKQRPSVKEFEPLIPDWFIEYGKQNYVLVSIDTDTKKCLRRILSRGCFDVEFADENYCRIQNDYFSALARVCYLKLIYT